MKKSHRAGLPKVIFIDWYKTLSNDLFWSHLTSKIHPYHQYHHEITQYLFLENKALINPWMCGQFTSEDISQKISQAIKLDKKIILRELAFSCKNMSFISPQIPKLIKSIQQKGTKVVIATDNMDTFRRHTIPGMNLTNIFDDFLISCELKCLKADFKKEKLLFFDGYLKNNNLLPPEVVLLDDHLDTTGIYNKLRFKIIEINSPKRLLEVLSLYAN